MQGRLGNVGRRRAAKRPPATRHTVLQLAGKLHDEGLLPRLQRLRAVPPCSCDNITIAPPLLKELEASTDPLPFKLWPRMVRQGATMPSCVPGSHLLIGRLCLAGFPTFGRPPQSRQRAVPFMQGGCEDEHVRMDFFARERFDQLHGEDQMAVDKLQEGIDNFAGGWGCAGWVV